MSSPSESDLDDDWSDDVDEEGDGDEEEEGDEDGELPPQLPYFYFLWNLAH